MLATSIYMLPLLLMLVAEGLLHLCVVSMSLTARGKAKSAGIKTPPCRKGLRPASNSKEQWRLDNLLEHANGRHHVENLRLA